MGKNAAAVNLGRLGGAVKSERKARAVRANLVKANEALRVKKGLEKAMSNAVSVQ